MSENDFLSRWSRLKRAAAKPAPAAQAQPAPADAPRDTTPQPGDDARPLPTEEDVDLSDLPSLEEITGATDITGFLQRKVPEELRRSALRKAWSSDPAIRDFIGPSENAWDFNDPNGIPGFGPLDLSAEQVRQMAKKLVGETGAAVERIESLAEPAPPPQPPPSDVARAAEEPPAGIPSPSAALQQIGGDEVESPGTEEEERDTPDTPSRPRRHGGALPR